MKNCTAEIKVMKNNTTGEQEASLGPRSFRPARGHFDIPCIKKIELGFWLWVWVLFCFLLSPVILIHCKPVGLKQVRNRESAFSGHLLEVPVRAQQSVFTSPPDDWCILVWEYYNWCWIFEYYWNSGNCIYDLSVRVLCTTELKC